MLDIKSFFGKFKKIDLSFTVSNENIQAAIKEACGVEVALDKIQVKQNKIYINESPLIRNEIFMHKEKISSALKSKNINLEIF